MNSSTIQIQKRGLQQPFCGRTSPSIPHSLLTLTARAKLSEGNQATTIPDDNFISQAVPLLSFSNLHYMVNRPHFILKCQLIANMVFLVLHNHAGDVNSSSFSAGCATEQACERSSSEREGSVSPVSQARFPHKHNQLS